MSTNAISPLRQRMIEDMNARKLGAHSQRSHKFCRVSQTVARYGHAG